MTQSVDNSEASIPGIIRDPITVGNLLRVNADGSINVTGGGAGTVTSLTAGSGIVLTPSTITGAGSIAAAQGSGSAAATSGAATLNQGSGVITSEALVGAVTYTLTLTNSKIASTSTVLVNATNSASLPVTLTSVTPGTGSVVIVVGMAALTGTVKIAFAVFN